jgi:hypothetical protein
MIAGWLRGVRPRGPDAGEATAACARHVTPRFRSLPLRQITGLLVVVPVVQALFIGPSLLLLHGTIHGCFRAFGCISFGNFVFWDYGVVPELDIDVKVDLYLIGEGGP